MGTVFKFKQFEVDQRDCAMKINTDGVLLGAIADADNSKNILDIGSGTGVISLMLAQRYSTAFIDAVEIDELAYQRTKSNFEQSLFADRLRAYSSSFEHMTPPHQYDMIVSNPPFYTNSLHNPNAKKKLARHTDLTFFVKLIQFGFFHLKPQGSLQLILPVDLATELLELAKPMGLYLSKQILVRSFIHSAPFRSIVELRKEIVANIVESSLVIYESQGEYTSEYKKILSPFFLAY